MRKNKMSDAITLDQVQQLNFHLAPQKTCSEIRNILNIQASFLGRIVYSIIGWDRPIIQNILEVATKTFVNLEKGTKVFDHPDSPEAHAYRQKFKPYLDLANAIHKKMAQFGDDPELKSAFENFKRQEFGLKYRLGVENGGMTKLPSPDGEIFDKLEKYTTRWKEKQPLTTHKKLNQYEIAQLKEAACYPEVMKFLFANPSMLEQFLQWAIRDYNSVEIGIHFPDLVSKFQRKYFVSGIFGRNRIPGVQELLKYEVCPTKVAGVGKRVLTLPVCHAMNFEHRPLDSERVNILKPNKEVHFKNGGSTLTIQEIFDDISKQNDRVPNVTINPVLGLMNFHAVKGSWNPITQSYGMPDMNKDNWVDYLPPCREWTDREMRDRYGAIVDEHSIFPELAASRSNDTAVGCHGFVKLYQKRLNVDGSVRCWEEKDIGIFAFRYPEGTLDELSFCCATMPRVLNLMDHNGSYTQREIATYAPIKTKEQIKGFLDELYEIRTKEGVFQFPGENCSAPLQAAADKTMGNMPDLYRVNPTRMKLGFAPIDYPLTFLDYCPRIIRNIGLAVLRVILGGWRSHNGKSVIDYYRRTDQLSYPGHLIDQVRDRKLPGRHFWGNAEGRDSQITTAA